jgi:hypothetical protein
MLDGDQDGAQQERQIPGSETVLGRMGGQQIHVDPAHVPIALSQGHSH